MLSFSSGGKKGECEELFRLYDQFFLLESLLCFLEEEHVVEFDELFDDGQFLVKFV